MEHAELVVLFLLVTVAALTTLARVIDVPYPILLVVGGSLVGFAPGVPDVELDPELVLFIFLPPLLFNAAYFSSLRDLRRYLRPITLSAIALVLLTTVAVAVIAHAAIAGLPWAAAFALGAIVSPTDPLAATTIARRLGVPRGRDVGDRGREPRQRRHRARRLPDGRGRGGRRASTCSTRPATSSSTWPAGSPSASSRPLVLVADLQADRRRRHRRRRALAGGRLHRLPAGGGDRRLGRARRGDGRPDRRAALDRDLDRRVAAARLRVLGGARLPAQRDAVRARGAAAAVDPGRAGALGGRAGRPRPAREPGRDRGAARCGCTRCRTSSARSTAARRRWRAARAGACG